MGRALLRAHAAVILASTAGALLCGAPPALAVGKDIPSVDVSTVRATIDGPNQGQWFVFSIAPGGLANGVARITNPARVTQTVRVYSRDLLLTSTGTPVLAEGTQHALGVWTSLSKDSLTILPGKAVDVTFRVRVPAAAEPGDHTGAIVAESLPQGGSVQIVKRVATRMYVTVPGVARRGFALGLVGWHVAGWWWPRQVQVTALLRNTGRVRLHPSVTIAKIRGRGATLLMADSTEPYAATVPVRWWGGVVHLSVMATTEGGLAQHETASLFIVPWGLLLLAFAATVVLAALVELSRRLRRRRGVVAELHAEVSRLQEIAGARR